jgi:hypothetical protein
MNTQIHKYTAATNDISKKGNRKGDSYLLCRLSTELKRLEVQEDF